MKEVKRLWTPLLLGTLLMGTLVAVAGAGPNARPEASPQLQNHMISAYHCIVDSDNYDYELSLEYVKCNSLTPPCGFACPIKPPHEGLIRVQRLAMYAYDNGGGQVRMSLRHVYPKTGTMVKRLTNLCTVNLATDPQIVTGNPANFKVSQLQDLYVDFFFTGTIQKLYGFKLRYEPL